MERIQNMVQSLAKCKVDFITAKEECNKYKELYLKSELELKETRELEKSHHYHLQTSREMIGNLQNTVSHLVYLKRDHKKLKDENVSKDLTIASMEKDKEDMQETCNQRIADLRKEYDQVIEELTSINDKKIQQIQYDSDTKTAQFTCVIEELRAKLKDSEKEHRDKMNVVVLEYEESMQRNAVEITQLQEQLRMQAATYDVNIDAYRKKLEDLEEKLKQNQFKDYLAQSNYPLHSSRSQFENRVERPYSGRRDYTDGTNYDSIPVYPSPNPMTNQTSNKNFDTPTLQIMHKDSQDATNFNSLVHPNPKPITNQSSNRNFNNPKLKVMQHDSKDATKFNSIPGYPNPKPNPYQTPNRNFKNPTPLQVMHHDKKTHNLSTNEKQGLFKITKKRKLYSEKDTV
ncbi:kinesin-like protein 1 [Maniola jurtina]|uniref:kinesin-like protein 1 n=1 Tax=Maniola jurtina TaxID=191418 RepID=UPI001E68B3F7|nr:kinesin-like protein 1 [Maniola jurtina]